MSTRGRKAELRVIEGGAQVDQPCDRAPGHINVAMHDEWLSVVSDLKRRKIYTDAMLGAVDTYITALWNMRQAQKALDDHGQLITTPKGVLMKNPAVTLHGKAQATVMRLAAELGLTPAARSRPKMTDADEDTTRERDLFDGPLLDFR